MNVKKPWCLTMAKKEIPNKTEREYIIPLRKKYQLAARYKKTPKAVKTVKEFLVKHMQIRDRDTNKIKIDKFLNEILWFNGIRNPPHKVRVKAVKEGDIIRVYAVDLPKKLEFKKKRFDKRTQEAKEAIEKKKTMMQKAKESMKATPKKEGEAEDTKTEEKTENKESQEKQKEAQKLDKKTDKPKEAKIPKQPKAKTTPQRKTMPQTGK